MPLPAVEKGRGAHEPTKATAGKNLFTLDLQEVLQQDNPYDQEQ